MSKSYGRILTVDDEPLLRDSIVAYLEDSGFTVFEAENGKEGLEIFRKEKPDLVLSDLQMPVMGGLEFLDALRKEAPHTPVIVISGQGVMKDAIEALRLGAWDYIVKPINDMAVLEHSVCKALERSRLLTENESYRIELEQANFYLSESLEELRQDQEAGKSVQKKMLPLEQRDFGSIKLSHDIIPSLYLSGDFVDYFNINDENIGFYIADVSGHGASSAFVTVWLKSLMAGLLSQYQNHQTDTITCPEKVLKYISDQVLSAKLGKYLTMVYCVLNIPKNTLNYSVGGHYPNPIIFDGQKANFLEGSGFAVGIFDKANYESKTIELPDNFSLVMFSDGILELMKEKELQDKEKQLLSIVASGEVTTEQILTMLNIKTDESIPDDVTVLLANRSSRDSKQLRQQ